MEHDIELAYLGLEVPDPGVLSGLFGEVVGLVPGAPAIDGSRTWRNDDKAHRLIVRAGPRNDAAFIGFEVSHGVAFDSTITRLRAAGHETVGGTPQEAAARRVERLALVTAPCGVAVEVVEGLEPAPTSFTSPLVRGGFLTSGVGFGHVVFATTAFEAAHQFLVDGLGLAQSDWLEMEIAPGIELEVHFLPLQRTSPLRRGGESTVRAAAEAAPPHGRDQQPR